MAKRKLAWTEEKIKQREKDGYGQGEGKAYSPWITVHDFPSKGRQTRGPGWKNPRIYHFMSDNELYYFYAQEWNVNVIDTREQYPLIRQDTLKIAQEKGIKHPVDPTTQVPIVMTTDFFLTVKEGTTIKYFARTIKPSSELEKKRIIDKFEIEREYWNQRNVDWGIVTEKEFPMTLIRNVEMIHQSYFGIDDMPPENYKIYSENIIQRINNNPNIPAVQITDSFDREFNLDLGTGLLLLKHLIAIKKLKINIYKKIDFGKCYQELSN